jgi:negative regulator of sigma E activity
MVRRLSVALLALLAGLTPAGASTGGTPDLALLGQVLAAPSTVSYTGVEEVVRMGGSAAAASVSQIQHRAPDLTRRRYTGPPRLFGNSEILKGNLKFAIDAKARRIVVTQNASAIAGGPLMQRREALIRANYRVVWRGTGFFGGRPVLDVLLVNKNTNRPTMLARIDRDTKIVLDKQEFADTGALISETRLEQIRYAPVPLGAFDLPKGYALVKPQPDQAASHDPDAVVRDAGFAARKFALPEGFTPLEADLLDMRGIRAVQVLYSDGLRTVSLFESAAAVAPDMASLHPASVEVAGRNAQYAEDGAVGLLTWNDGTLYYTLVGELGRSELAQIAQAITK